jgi:hypothetical protein
MFAVSAVAALAVTPLQLLSENPHYFLFRGQKTLIVTSGEHYGAVLNPDFNFTNYLETLAKDGLNGTRTWAGAYCEPQAAFNIAANTLAPAPGRFLAPWARSGAPGYANGGNKFDLSKWDDAYFTRLKAFMRCASEHGIIVEINLFCPFYEESMWALSPMNAVNNINGIGSVARTNVYTLEKNGGLLAVQESLVRKLVTELRGFDNLYYEICNEPYFGGVTPEWQRRIADVIVETERGTGTRHLISQNVANGSARVENPYPSVSIFNFHYATPPDAVAVNYGLNKVIGDNETGFKGTNDATYRMEAWDFVIAGGGLFNHLDYSFTAGHENGSFAYPASQPGGGSPTLRKQLSHLLQFTRQLDIPTLRPMNGLIHATLPPGVSVRAMTRPGPAAGAGVGVGEGAGTVTVAYLRTGLESAGAKPPFKTRFGEGELSLDIALAAGEFDLEWFDTKTGAFSKPVHFTLTTASGRHTMAVPTFEDDIALVIRGAK